MPELKVYFSDSWKSVNVVTYKLKEHHISGNTENYFIRAVWILFINGKRIKSRTPRFFSVRISKKEEEVFLRLESLRDVASKYWRFWREIASLTRKKAWERFERKFPLLILSSKLE